MPSQPIAIGIVSVGKIVRDQHLPAIAKDPSFRLLAAASRNASVDGVASFPSLEAMLAAVPDLEAVSLCMPPSSATMPHERRLPPASTSSWKSRRARRSARSRTSRRAPRPRACRCSPAGTPATRRRSKPPGFLLSQTRVRTAAIIWKEDVRRWHPGQAWIWEPGGFGVFDPGINALSIATHIFRRRSFSPQPGSTSRKTVMRRSPRRSISAWPTERR